MPDLSVTDWMVLVSLIIGLGGVAGFMAGLLGIGGGVVLVPGLYYIFGMLGFPPDHLMHVAVGTSLTIIIPTGISSARAHIKKNGVRFDLVKRIGIGIVLGVGVGTFVADYISGQNLKIVFSCALMVFAAIMQIDPQKFRLCDDVPPQPWSGMAGGLIGILSSLMGIGGATLNVPYMSLHGVPIHTAVGTSSAMGPLIAIPGAIGFIWIGWGLDHLPPYSLGYVNLLAALAIMPISVLCAPWGARVAHRVSVKKLRLVFSVFIILVAVKMLHGALTG